MRQQFGKWVSFGSAVNSANGPPAGNVGIEMASLRDGRPTAGTRKHDMFIDLGGTGAATLYLWVLSQVDGNAVWGVRGSQSLDGVDRQEYFLELRNLGGYERAYLEVADITGTVSVQAWLSEHLERDD